MGKYIEVSYNERGKNKNFMCGIIIYLFDKINYNNKAGI